MKFTIIQTGKTHFNFVNQGFEEYLKRINNFIKTEYLEVLPAGKLKNTNPDIAKKNEAQLQLKLIKPTDYLILLDDKGKEHTSFEFSRQLEKWLLHQSNIIFLIGGAYGFDASVYDRANAQISLSKLTFSHQLVKLIFAEQLYRAFCILKNHPYHHE